MAAPPSQSDSLYTISNSSHDSTAPPLSLPLAPASTDLKTVKDECTCMECKSLAPWLECAQANALRDALNHALGLKVGAVLGIGGISVCFEAEKCEQAVALKISHSTANNDFIASVAQDEKDVLEDLQLARRRASAITDFHGATGIPRVYSSGSVEVRDCTHHYIIMQRLGSNLDALIRQDVISKSNFAKYALGMLEAVKTVHEAGWVHLDIKPGNFCMHHKSGDPAEGVYIIDFGGARRATWAEDTDDEYVYFGTADYSGSTAMLQQMMPGPSDDIESLCYSFLHMWNNELPWKVTENFEMGEDGWTVEDIVKMLELRKEKWKELCHEKVIPLFLQQLHQYTMSLKTYEMPDYRHIRRIIKSADSTPLQQPAHARTKRRASEPAAVGPRDYKRLFTAVEAHWLQPEE